jgi:hypothetical protein
MGLDPYLQQAPHQEKIRFLTGFAAQTRMGYYGKGQQVQSSTVTGAITAIGQTIALACNKNPTKVIGSDKFLLNIQIMLDGYTKANPPTKKMLPVEFNVPEMLIDMGYGKLSTVHLQTIGNLTLIVFYYLLPIGEYTAKQSHKQAKQTVQFKLEDVTIFKTDKHGTLRCILQNVPSSLLMTTDSTKLKLDNQKNGWKGVCGHQENNGEVFKRPVQALARQVTHLQENGADGKTFLSAFFMDGTRYGVMGEDISKSLKRAAMLFNYPKTRGIPIARIDTHFLRSGGANALALSRYFGTQIQKWGSGRAQL